MCDTHHIFQSSAWFWMLSLIPAVRTFDPVDSSGPMDDELLLEQTWQRGWRNREDEAGLLVMRVSDGNGPANNCGGSEFEKGGCGVRFIQNHSRTLSFGFSSSESRRLAYRNFLIYLGL
ncbi:hypothetical protein DFH08DRAFT_808543 [Mycena albidolilacea]|uniref:Secreted protein n=1 Tax=Mycena albidolilacea TaxID=1033008 RepID=A0AAD7A1M9_9AGAR|nr:hypothetical protein DFH08DRAFT_808543 [Mycena albidolilacea]